jgi:hypothetical protein
MRTIVLITIMPMLLAGCFHKPSVSDLAKIHSEFNVDWKGGVSLCGTEQGKEIDGNKILSKMKLEYGLESFFSQRYEYLEREVFPKYKNAPEFPKEIDGYFDHDYWVKEPEVLDLNHINTTSELEKILTNSLLKIYHDEARKVLRFREISGLTISEALHVRDEWFIKYQDVVEGNTIIYNEEIKKLNVKQKEKFKVASCIFNNPSYITYGDALSENDYLLRSERENSINHFDELREDAIELGREYLTKNNVIFDLLKPGDGIYGFGAYFEAYKDGEKVGIINIDYSDFQDIYKFKLTYTDWKTGKHLKEPAFFYN